PATGVPILSGAPSSVGVLGSDAQVTDDLGNPLDTITKFTTIITPATAGTLSFNWFFQTDDAGSHFDPAGYFFCSASFPFGGMCGQVPLTADLDFFSNPGLPGAPPFPESGTVSNLVLSAGDEFGVYVETIDNFGGAGQMIFSDIQTVPEPATITLIASGLLVLLLVARRKALS